ncbi:MAG: hypothetical protein AMXMBFR84_48200 [Candidatus Hydrogenedentota bacterium]
MALSALKRFPRQDRDAFVAEIMACFEACMPLEGPLVTVLRKALYRVCQWYPNPEPSPTMGDLYRAAKQVLNEQSYRADIKGDLYAALDNRLGTLSIGSLGKIFQPARNCPEFGEIIEGYSIIDLSGLSDAEKSIFMVFFLSRLQLYITHQPVPAGDVQLVILVDEAHALAPSSDPANRSSDTVDQVAAASKQACKFVKEFRKQKVGFLPADQSCKNVAPDLIELTSTKLTYRIQDLNSRELLGGTMLFSDTQREHVARLATGQGYLFAETYHRPILLHTVDLTKAIPGLSSPPTYDEIKAAISERPWFRRHHATWCRTNLNWLQREFAVLKAKDDAAKEHTRRIEHESGRNSGAGVNMDQTAEVLARMQGDAVAQFYFELYEPIISHIGVDVPADVKRTKSQIVSEFEARFGDTVKSLVNPKNG